jgi:hypothetical protein
MSYQTPITIKQALERIHRHDYVLPAIQREFVWNPDQVCRLFDSLLRGYPIGTFLFWQVSAETASQFQFYDVMRDYHEVKSSHSPKIDDFSPRSVTAILDGQQRLSALNIGLRGSYATKVPRKRLDPYPVRHLYLDLCFVPAEDDEIEYRFEFLTPEEAQRSSTAGTNPGDPHWYSVADVLHVTDLLDVIAAYIQPQGLGAHPGAFKVLGRLFESVHNRPVIAYFEEEEQSLSKVLDIFVRVNSGGTVLSKSDLMLSIATAQFRERDAREAIHGLVDDLNSMAHGFNFTKDMVLKTGLVLSGVSDPTFKVQSFSVENMRRLDQEWDGIERSLRLAARLAASFGFSARTLSGNSVLIPVAHYLHDRQHDEGYLTQARWEADRAGIHGWMLRTLIKPGIWGSGLDSLLKSLSRIIVSEGGPFPVEQLEAEMARLGKALIFDEQLLLDLVETPYRNKRVFALLAMLYPGVDVRNDFHEDHVFPRARFTRPRLIAAGIPASDVADYQDRFDRLPNLQLLEGSVNVSKQQKLPADWIRERFVDPQARQMWLAAHDLHDLPEAIEGFADFYDARRDRLLARLRSILGQGRSIVETSAAPVPMPRVPEATDQPGLPAVPSSLAPERTRHDPGSEVGGDSRKRRQTHRTTIRDLVEMGRLTPGEVLHGSQGTRRVQATVLADGTLTALGEVFGTPSKAAMSLTGALAVNGWVFWRTNDGTKIADLR